MTVDLTPRYIKRRLLSAPGSEACVCFCVTVENRQTETLAVLVSVNTERLQKKKKKLPTREIDNVSAGKPLTPQATPPKTHRLK